MGGDLLMYHLEGWVKGKKGWMAERGMIPET
jgi:hypothetical protein